jgi:DNA polymerase III delta prime subunit
MKIFLSSTILDLKDLRDALVTWLETDGHQVIASEKGTLPIEPDKHSYDQCLKAVAECDCLVAVIDGRFGGEYPKKGLNRSITEEEIATAIAQGKKTLVFVRQSIWDAMATQQTLIKSGAKADYWSVKNIVEDIRVFGLIDRLKKQPINNWIFQFNAPTDLIATIRVQISSSPTPIDWHRVCNDLFADQKQRLSSNPLHGVKPKNFDGVYVPLGLVKRETKERPQLDRGLDPSADRGSEFYQIETTPIEHDDFLQTVIDQQPGEHIVILGEPGAGKTTLLTGVWQSLLEQMNSEALMIVAWVPLAALTNQGLAGYLEDVWLHKFCGDNKSSYWESFKELAAAGWVYLLLDGADEMGGDGLTKIQSILEQSWKKLRVVITCQLNLWDGGSQNVLKEQFKIFRTLDFSYDNPDRVQQFIDKWFEGAEAGRNLRSALDEVGKERIKDLAQNPLRLTLLCNIWQKSGGLPDTQAGLYEQFVNFVYGWSKVPDAKELQLELDRAMGQLAKYGINKPVLRFRFTERELQAQVPNIEHRKALKALGWLNCVGEDQEGNEVYAFFHPTFQEYFAACSIDDWDYFLPRAHVDRPVPCQGEEVSTYRVFEKHWKQTILLWFGRKDLTDNHKNEFLEKLTNFEAGCESSAHYYIFAYRIAAIGVGEFKSDLHSKLIVKKIVEFAFVEYNTETKEWQKAVEWLEAFMKETIYLTNQSYVIESLRFILSHSDPDSDQHNNVKRALEQITTQNKRNYQFSDNIHWTSSRRYSDFGFPFLGHDIIPNQQQIEDAIAKLEKPIIKNENVSLKATSRWSLGPLNHISAISILKRSRSNEQAIEALITFLTRDCSALLSIRAAEALGEIVENKESAVKDIANLLKNADVEYYVCLNVFFAMREIVTKSEMPLVISSLKNYIMEQSPDPDHRRFDYCQMIVVQYAQILSYPVFYNAWHRF